jgi:hypothetical protein
MSESATQLALSLEDPEPERWLPAVGYEGFYEVSDLGRVRSVLHQTIRGMQGGRIRKPQNAGRGYRALRLSVHGKITGEYVHHMVMAAFVGRCPKGKEILHGDDDRTNNRLSNLRYDTHKRNQEEASERGRSAFGERNGMAIVTEEIVAEIRSAAAAGVQQIAIAEYHGISRAQTCRIVLRRNWNRVPDLSSVA